MTEGNWFSILFVVWWFGHAILIAGFQFAWVQGFYRSEGASTPSEIERDHLNAALMGMLFGWAGPFALFLAALTTREFKYGWKW